MVEGAGRGLGERRGEGGIVVGRHQAAKRERDEELVELVDLAIARRKLGAEIVEISVAFPGRVECSGDVINVTEEIIGATIRLGSEVASVHLGQTLEPVEKIIPSAIARNTGSCTRHEDGLP
jgi:hypothetical protein